MATVLKLLNSFNDKGILLDQKILNQPAITAGAESPTENAAIDRKSDTTT